MSANRVVPYLWQGPREELGRAAAYDFVVSAALERHPPRDVRYLHVKLDDRPTDWSGPGHKFWRAAVRYAAKKVAHYVSRTRKTLVVCAMGLNRSGLVTAMALRYLGYTPQEAIALVRTARGPQALSNPTFVDAVKNMEL